MEIEPNLWLGGKSEAVDRQWLSEREIGHILNVTDNIKNYFEGDEVIKYMQIKVTDSFDAPIDKYFTAGVAFIHQALNSASAVLVHCKEGRSRSTSLVVAYLIKHKKLQFEVAHVSLLISLTSFCSNKRL